MAQSDPGTTFFLPILFLIFIEFTRVAREIDIIAAVETEQRPLFLSVVFSIPFDFARRLLRAFIRLVESQVQSIHNQLNRPNILAKNLLDLQIALLEELGGDLLSDQGLKELKRSNEAISQVYEERLESANAAILTKLQLAQNRWLTKITRLEKSVFPTLGRFAFIHVVNYAIVLYMFILTNDFLLDVFRRITLPIVGLLLVFLPVIEVEEYDHILEEDISLRSFRIHFGISIILLLYIFLLPPATYYDPVFEGVQKSVFGYPIQDIPIMHLHLIILTSFVAIWAFLSRLNTEVSRI